MTSSIRSCLHKPQHNCSNTRNTLPRGRLTRPRGPILGARADVAPTSPPVHLRYTGRSKTINASVGGVGGSPPNHTGLYASFRGWTRHLFTLFKTAPRPSAESGGRHPPPRRHRLKRGPLKAPRGTAAFGTATSAEAHTEPARSQPNRQPTKWARARRQTLP